MVKLPTYYICLICTAIESPHQGGLPHQGADKAYVILLPEATYISQNGLFALLIVACPASSCPLFYLSTPPGDVTSWMSHIFSPKYSHRICLYRRQKCICLVWPTVGHCQPTVSNFRMNGCLAISLFFGPFWYSWIAPPVYALHETLVYQRTKRATGNPR